MVIKDLLSILQQGIPVRLNEEEIKLKDYIYTIQNLI